VVEEVCSDEVRGSVERMSNEPVRVVRRVKTNDVPDTPASATFIIPPLWV